MLKCTNFISRRLGIAYFVMAYGLLKGKGWAWTITVVLSCIGIALGFVSVVTGNVGAIFKTTTTTAATPTASVTR
jgi:hypothetical protein